MLVWPRWLGGLDVMGWWWVFLMAGCCVAAVAFFFSAVGGWILLRFLMLDLA